MKEKLKSFSVLFFSALFLFNSCENFLDSKAVKEELDQEISYAKSPSFTIRVSPEKPEMGNVVTGNEKSVKVRDSFTVSFECSSEYIFEKWVVIDKDSGENASDYLDIENPSKQETKLKYPRLKARDSERSHEASLSVSSNAPARTN